MEIPKYEEYFPSIQNMNSSQKKFYYKVEEALLQEKYIEINGNISYVFVFIYKLLSKWDKKGYEYLSDYLIYISELYKENKKIYDYCKYWGYDCLLGLEKYEEYLERTEQDKTIGTNTHFSNLRLNISKKINFLANPIDILLMCNGRKTKFIANNEGIYKEKIIEVFNKYQKDNGNWFELFNKWSYETKTYPHYLFQGSPLMENPKLKFEIECFYSTEKISSIINELSKEAENIARKELGIPLIGEGWVSETVLYKKIKEYYFRTLVIQHGQPEWLGKQHYDIWFPHWKIAVEYHGTQHFQAVDFFGGEQAFKKTQERDKRKINLSKRNGIKLLIVTEETSFNEIILEIDRLLLNRKILLDIAIKKNL